MTLVIKYIETIEELSKSKYLHEGMIADFTKEILEKSCDTLGCERSNAWLLKEDGDELKCIMAYSKGSKSFESTGVLCKKDLPIYFNNLLRNEIIVSADAQSEPVNTELLDNYLKANDITSMIDVPLRSEGKMIGVICFEHVKMKHEWSNEEKKFTQSLAQLLSLALETKEKKEYRGKLERIIGEKEVLISEINHRVKNNMAVIVSLLNLQKTKARDNFHSDLFEGIKDKVYSMSMVQEQLHASENVNRIDFCVYIRKLIMNLNDSYGQEKEVSIDMDLENVNLDVSRAIPCGLIANEVLTNSFKYAFGEKNVFPKLKVSLKNDGNMVKLKFADNGEGFDLDQVNDGMGLDLINGLAEQVDGEINLNASNGVETTLIFNV
jgi:two-component sensor histidine kinase